MKRIESEEERNDVKKAVKGRCIIPIRLTFSLFPLLTSALNCAFEWPQICQEKNKFS